MSEIIFSQHRNTPMVPSITDEQGNFVACKLESLNRGLSFFDKWKSIGSFTFYSDSLKILIDHDQFENIDTISELTKIAIFTGGEIIDNIKSNSIHKQLPIPSIFPDNGFIKEQLILLRDLEKFIKNKPITPRLKDKHGFPGSIRNQSRIKKNGSATMYLTQDTHDYICLILNDLINIIYEDSDGFSIIDQFHEIDIRDKQGNIYSWVENIRGKFIIKQGDKFFLQIPVALGINYLSSTDGVNYFYATVLEFGPNSIDGIKILAYSDYKIPYNFDKEILRIIVTLMCSADYRSLKTYQKQKNFLINTLRTKYSMNIEGRTNKFLKKYISKAQNIFRITPQSIEEFTFMDIIDHSHHVYQDLC